MTAQSCDIAGCVAGYAARLHAVIGDGHHVASPLGAWLLLALAGPASTGDDRVTLQNVLGCDVDVAADAAAALLASPHPEVASAVAVWVARSASLGEAFGRWRSGLPPTVSQGEVPDQAGLDAWAREHTLGLIERFPLRGDGLYLVLATALATKVTWRVAFELVPAAELGPDSPWSGRLRKVLRAPVARPGAQTGHSQFIAVTEEAGDVAVHVAAAQDGLLVCSVAADRAVPAGRVLAVAHRIACAHAVGASVPRRRLADLPLGAGPAWLLREEPSDQVKDRCTAVLPAWLARSEHDLADPELGFGAAGHAILPGPDPWEARQAAMARYSREGFEAAAVTGLAVAMAMARPGIRRVADLRFGHPYAVVAVTVDGTRAGRVWHGVPVFSAWVTSPADADDDGQADGQPDDGRPDVGQPDDGRVRPL
jgi:hypothetical protein